jgi:hypothetical protein
VGSQVFGSLLGGHESVSLFLLNASSKSNWPSIWVTRLDLRQLPNILWWFHGWRIEKLILGGFDFRQPILADEVQTFKALITVHKVLQEGHPTTLRDAMANRSWIDSLNRGMSGEGLRGYGPLIKEYVNFLLAKLTFHQQHPDFNGTFEYEEYISLKGINDPNEGYETISDLMMLQDRIEQFQKLIFSHFRSGGNNECRISALVPLVQESYGIYKFITSMLRAMHTS